MNRESEDARATIEAAHPVVKNAGVKGVGCGIVALVVIAAAGFLIWSMSPLAPIGVAYSAVGAIPWLIGAGGLLLGIRLFTRRK